MPVEVRDSKHPCMDYTIAEFLAEDSYSVLDLDPSKIVGRTLEWGNVFVVAFPDGRRRLAGIKLIPENGLKFRRPHSQHPVFHKHANFHTCMELDQVLALGNKQLKQSYLVDLDQ